MYQPPETAPKGEMVDVTKGDKTFKQHRIKRIIGSADGHVAETYWIPQSDKIHGRNGGRWHGHSVGVELDGWMYLPPPVMKGSAS